MSTPAVSTPPGSAPVSARSRWLARASLAAAVAAVAVYIAGAGTHSLGLLLLVVGTFVLVAIGLWLALAHHGLIRALGVVLAIGVLAASLGITAAKDLVWVVVVTVALLVVAVWLGQAALRPPGAGAVMPEHRASPPQRPFMVMNPRSGGGKVEKFDLRGIAEQLGAEVAMIEGPGEVDVAELARKAVGNGADLLGVAGGDGTQALVAGVAAEHGIPLLVIPAGTRNHFALDLGLDRDDPSLSLNALVDGVDLHIDLGDVEGRPFVNNVSFGAYADIVARPEYRDDKVRVTLQTLPEALSSHTGPKLTVRYGGESLQDPQAALVSNNPYGMGDVAGLGRRARIDGGELGLVAVKVDNAVDAARLVGGRLGPGVTVTTAEDITVESEGGTVAAGIDGESVVLPSPVRCRVRPHALTVRVPRARPGVPSALPPVTLASVTQLALPHRKGRENHS